MDYNTLGGLYWGPPILGNYLMEVSLRMLVSLMFLGALL